MAKNIVVFSDGTGNSSGKLFKTNVWRLYEALDLTQADQIAYYDNGVGTSSFKPFAILGGALGLGLKRNVRDLYAFLCRNWAPGDKIYAFGFSRGAFTIRVLIGFVHDQGLASATSEEALQREVRGRWRAYRERARTRVLGGLRTRVLGRREASANPKDSRIKFTFVGLWDTVAAYGLPIDELTRAWDQYVWPLSMNDRVPSTTIEKAFHALALEDERQTFHPVLWTEAGEPANVASTHLNKERISQVWFSGVHSNVGGGYPDDSLSFVSLDWIMTEGGSRGLRYIPGAHDRIRAESTAMGPIYDSRRGLAGYYRYNPRKIERLTSDPYHGVLIKRPKIHESVLLRLVHGNDRYAPIVLPRDYAVVDTKGVISPPKEESPTQAADRAKKQERVWDEVWKRRFVYFLTVFSSVFLLLFPAIFKTASGGTCLSDCCCWISPPLAWVESLLPAFTDPWIHAFRSNPGWFLFGVGLVASLLGLSAWLETRIKDRMRRLWDDIIAAPAVAPTAEPGSFIFRLRTHRAYQAFFQRLSRYVLPAFFAAGFYFCAVALVSRVELAVASAVGSGCAPSERARSVTSAAKFKFDTRNPCAASGYRLQEGVRYRLWIEIEDGKAWSDASIVTDLGGFSFERMSWPMYFALPFRRLLAEPWFKPVARVGARGSDEYALSPMQVFVAGEKRDRLYTELHARRGGELFLYVNDAVFLWPWLHTYDNNHGAATVTVERIAPPVRPRS